MFGKHTNSVLALAAFVAVGVLMPDLGGNTRQLSVDETKVRNGMCIRSMPTT